MTLSNAEMDDRRVMVVACARAAHEANRAYCIAIGDMSQLPWDEAPKWQTDSVILGVEAVLRGATPEQSHEGWLAHKAAEGWVWGPVKDVERKQHPCFLPYAQLPADQQAKDHIFGAVVRTIAASLEAPR